MLTYPKENIGSHRASLRYHRRSLLDSRSATRCGYWLVSTVVLLVARRCSEAAVRPQRPHAIRRRPHLPLTLHRTTAAPHPAAAPTTGHVGSVVRPFGLSALSATFSQQLCVSGVSRVVARHHTVDVSGYHVTLRTSSSRLQQASSCHCCCMTVARRTGRHWRCLLVAFDGACCR